MGITYNKGRKLSRNENAFDESFVTIGNPCRQLDNKTFLSLETFHTKKAALAFCEKYSLTKSRVIRVESRFQFGWVIDLGRSQFVPRYAEGHLLMAAFGFKLGSVNDNSMWL